MNSSIYRINLDIHDARPQASIRITQNDTARRIVISLSDGGVPYIIADDCYAAFTALKPDGTVLYNDTVIVQNSKIQYDITAQTVAATGTVECQIRIYGTDGTLITSPCFTILVTGRVFDDSIAEGTDQFTLLDELVTSTASLKSVTMSSISDAKAATTLANTAALEAHNAASGATASASNAESAAESANNAVSVANSAAASANTAAENANTAAASANTAASSANTSAENANVKSDLAEAAAENADAAATEARGMFDSFLDISSSFNIYDADSITREIFVYEGQESPNSVYFATGYMKCKGGDTLHVQFETPQGVRVDLAEYTSFADIRYMEAYDENKVYITGSNVGNQRTYTVPDGASYVRFTFYLGFLSNASDIMIFPSSDTSIVSYTAYDEKNVCVKKSCLPVTEIKAFFPGEICVAVGRTIEIYNSQVCPNASNYHFKWKCQIGKALQRKFSVTGFSDNVGTYTLELEIYDNENIMRWSGSSTLKIVSVLSSEYKVVPIGDSLTNIKRWMPEVMNLSGGKVSFVGTRAFNLKDSEEVAHTGFHEGRSGWSAARYNQSGDTVPDENTYKYANPFYNPAVGHFDWNFYVTNSLGGVSPDGVQLFLGTNGISLDPEENASAVKTIVDYIRQDDANIHIYVVYIPYRSNQNGIGFQTASDGFTALNSGAYKLEEDMKVFNLMSRLNTLLKDYQKLFFIPLSLCHDSENNYGAVAVSVNPRSPQTEYFPSESVHPQAEGYFQFADVIFSTYSAHASNI